MSDQIQETKTEEKASAQLFWGADVVTEITPGFKEGTKRVSTSSGSFDVPEWESTVCVTSAETNETDLRNLRAIYVVQQLMKVIYDLDIRVEELGTYVRKLLDSVGTNEEIVRLKACGFNPTNLVELNIFKGEVRLSNWDKLLKS